MLTFDLVRARVTRDRVVTRALTNDQRDAALDLAEVYLHRLELGRGRSRQAVQPLAASPAR